MTTLARKYLKTMSDEELHEMIRRDYLRRLIRYRKIDEMYRQKYGMTFEEFESHNVVAEQNYSWEAESDAQEWEAAIDGIRTMLEKLQEFEVGVI